MPDTDVTQLVERKKRGEDGLDSTILDLIARDMYAHPRYYGLHSEEDVGELFERYWTRIAGIVDRYQDVGASFNTFLKTSIRFMALSIRRKKACSCDKEAIFLADRKARYASEIDALDEHGTQPEDCDAVLAFPRLDDTAPSAVAFRRRMKFLCIKCANMLDDSQAIVIAKAVGIDQEELVTCMKLARSRGLGLRQRSLSRRRGRDAAWLRMGVCRRRLSRETDPYKRRRLEEALEKDHAQFIKTIALMDRSTPIISNKAVAELLGIPKGTVDCGVVRILKQYRGLYTDRNG
jgi:DNA-directed RNA polymerase specialized sigma24 family protein